jgi:hypothetical protein
MITYKKLNIITPLIEGTQTEIEWLDENVHILAEGVKGLACLETREPTAWEKSYYGEFCPVGCVPSWVELYENGAMNIAVKSTFIKQRVIGAILVRPMEPYNAEKEYKTLKEKYG